MRSAPYVHIVAPNLLEALSYVSPISIGNHTTMIFGVPVVVSYLMNLAQGMSGTDAYLNIVFEVEAYAKMHDPEYTRPWFGWARSMA